LKGAMSRFFTVEMFFSDTTEIIFSYFPAKANLIKTRWTCIKILGNNFITYKKKKTNLVIFNAGKNFQSKIRSWACQSVSKRRRINNFCIRNRFSLMKTTCLNRFSRNFHDNHWKHVRGHPMGTSSTTYFRSEIIRHVFHCVLHVCLCFHIVSKTG
jgi:hypothetical protein